MARFRKLALTGALIAVPLVGGGFLLQSRSASEGPVLLEQVARVEGELEPLAALWTRGRTFEGGTERGEAQLQEKPIAPSDAEQGRAALVEPGIGRGDQPHRPARGRVDRTELEESEQRRV